MSRVRVLGGVRMHMLGGGVRVLGGGLGCLVGG